MNDTPFLNDLQREAAEVPAHPRERLKYLTQLRNEITFEITRIRSMLGLPLVERPIWYCRRCGNEWAGFSIDRPPRSCPRCHSVGWNEEPVSPTARKPSDPPNPRWYKRKDSPAPAPTSLASLIIVPTPSVGENVREQVGPRGGYSGGGLPPPPTISEWPEEVRSLSVQLREIIQSTQPAPLAPPTPITDAPKEVTDDPNPATAPADDSEPK